MRNLARPQHAKASGRRRAVSKLLWTTGLASAVFGFSGTAHAQVYGDFGEVTRTAFTAGDAAPTITTTMVNIADDRLSVVLNAQATVLDWKNFSVVADRFADFTTARADQVSILNRVIEPQRHGTTDSQGQGSEVSGAEDLRRIRPERARTRLK